MHCCSRNTHYLSMFWQPFVFSAKITGSIMGTTFPFVMFIIVVLKISIVHHGHTRRFLNHPWQLWHTAVCCSTHKNVNSWRRFDVVEPWGGSICGSKPKLSCKSWNGGILDLDLVLNIVLVDSSSVFFYSITAVIGPNCCSSNILSVAYM